MNTLPRTPIRPIRPRSPILVKARHFLGKFVLPMVARVSTEDSELAGSFIPKGTLLNVNIFDTHHSEKNWSDPLKFDPDRFSSESEGKQSSSWVPFGGGARQCIGMNFSLNEQRVMLSMLLRKYTWKLPEDSIHKNTIKTTGIGVIGPLDLKIEFTKIY